MSGVLFAVITLMQGMTFFQGASDVAEQTGSPLLRNAFVQWQNYRQISFENVAGYEMRVRITNSQGVEFHREYGRYRRRNGLWIWQWSVDRTGTDADGRRWVIAKNSRYGFELRDPKPNGNYVLSNLGYLAKGVPEFLADYEKAQQGLFKENPDDVEHHSLCVFSLLQKRWPRVLKSADTVIKSVEQDSTERTLVRVDVEYLDRRWPVRAKAAFDTARYWVPISCELTWADVPMQIRNYYDRDVRGIPLLTKSEWTCNGRDFQRGVREYVYELVSDPWSESEFTLSAFGLAEPFGEEQVKPIPWGLYIIGGTLAMVVVMGVGWRIRRWRAAT
jgi:hypothetical protein